MGASMERRAGQWVGEQRRRRARRGIAICTAGLVPPALAFALAAPWWVASLACLASVAATLITERKVLPVVERWSRGEQGELVVGELLESLAADGWRVLHDISLGRGNIDHVLIGPAGIFTIETKSHAGRIHIDRVEQRMLSQAYAQRKSVERITQREVDALLVFSRAYLTPAVSRRRGVLVLPARMLKRHLERRPAVLEAGEVERTHALLRNALAH
jgi:hypothetical protein